VLHHFSTKHDLFMTLVEKREEVYQAVDLSAESVRALFDQFIEAVRAAAAEPDLLRFRVMLTGAYRVEAHAVEGRAQRTLEFALDTFVPLVERRITAGEIAVGTDPQQLILELLALNEGIRDQWSTLPERIDYVGTFTAAANGLYERVSVTPNA